MDIDEEHVAVLVDQLDRLLHPSVARGYLHQSVETPHAVVDVHHIVARTQLVQLGDGHLLVAPDFAVDAVTLVTVENLVVGIEAQLQVVVHESLVQGHRQRPHDGLPAANLVEDVLQTLHLRLVLRKNIGIVSPQGVADHIVRQHLEIFIEFRLRGCRKLYTCFRRPFGKVVPQDEHPASGEVGRQSVAAREQRIDLLGVLHVRQRLAAHVVDPPEHEIGVVEPPGGLRARKAHEGDLCRGRRPGIQVGDNLHSVELVRRQLARDVEPPDRIHLIAEEIQSVGFALRIGEDVDDTAAHRILSGLVDEIHPREDGVDKLLLQHLDRDLVPDPHGNRSFLERLGIGDPLGQRLGIGADDQIALPRKAPHGIHRRRALHHALRILGAIGRRTLPRRGKEINLRLLEQVVKVVHQIGRGIAILGHENVHPAALLHGCRGIKRKSTADQLFEVFVFAAQPAEGLRPGGELRQLLAGSHKSVNS